MIDAEVLQQVLDELISPLQDLETQNAAILQFMKDRGIAGDEDLAPFRQKAGSASSVRWRAARIRVNHLLSTALKETELSREESRQATDAKKDQKDPAKGRIDSQDPEKDAELKIPGAKNEGDGRTDRKNEEAQEAEAGKRDQAAGKDAV